MVRQLIEGTAEALGQASGRTKIFEEFDFLFGGAERFGAQTLRRAFRSLGEGDDVENFQGAFVAERRPRHAAIAIGEGIEPDDTIRRGDSRKFNRPHMVGATAASME